MLKMYFWEGNFAVLRRKFSSTATHVHHDNSFKIIQTTTDSKPSDIDPLIFLHFFNKL